jgi:homoserine kinase
MPASQVTVKVPATTANLGPGFDVFGMALEQPSDKITLIADSAKGVAIQVSGVYADTIPLVPERNTAGLVANCMLQEFSLRMSVSLKIEKGIWPGKGLGSSAASAAGAAFGLNCLFNLGLSREELIRFAAKGEVASAGSEHADNVSAAICGGFVIIKSSDPLSIVCLEPPANMEVCVAIPNLVTPPQKTQRARSVVPKLVSINKLTCNVGNAAAIASGFATGDVDLIGESMSDVIVEPARASLVPGYWNVKIRALEAGACGVAISGAGPAVLAIINNKKAKTLKVAQAMKEAFKSSGLDSITVETKPGKGASIVAGHKD